MSKMFRFLAPAVVLAALLPLTPACAAEAPSAPHCNDMDFLIGHWHATAVTWNVAELPGAHGVIGDVTWEPSADHCYLTETWRGQNGVPNFSGLMAYSSDAHDWGYFAVSEGGIRLHFDYGLWHGDEVAFVQVDPSDGKSRQFSYTRLPGDKIREVSSLSVDGGHSWTTEYEVSWERAR